MSTRTRVHIINHTHWDREWFLTSVYTSRWIPELLDRIRELAEANPHFRYLFDGQTLVLEDLQAVAPDHVPLARELVRRGHLIVGPYYCQPDWKLSGGELLVRNLALGRADMARWGGQMTTGWLVDTFGHIGQAPQIHRLFDIHAVYVWRGVPRLAPYFHWQGADGSTLFTVDLFGGYRNLYGVTHAPQVAVKRLHTEVERLRPYYPTPDIPLFDGYDLETDPEDPMRFFAQVDNLDPDLELLEATPTSFVQTVQSYPDLALPTLQGELNSGKYGAVFPGVLSARTYLKVMAADCQQRLFGYAEPLAALAHSRGRPFDPARFENWTRVLLQNAVHDCICGVSIDQVHEKMELLYHQVFRETEAEIQRALDVLLADQAPGRYAVSTVPTPVERWEALEDGVVHVQTDGVGIWPLREPIPLAHPMTPAAGLSWQNDHYTATVTADGTVQVGDQVLGYFRVVREEGDTYSDEGETVLGVLAPVAPPVVEEEAGHVYRVVGLTARWQADAAWVEARVRIRFDASPQIRWTVDLDSRGADLRVEMVFATGRPGPVWAGMPFEMVARPIADRDLLPRKLDDPALANLLLGQREVDVVTTFPFQDVVARADARGTTAVLARGLHAYRAGEDGALFLILRRTVEWLTRGDLRRRVGDAGPFFYVPDARCERTVRHELAVVTGDFPPDGLALQAQVAAFRTPPLVVTVSGNGGTPRAVPLWRESAPMSSLRRMGDRLVARIYNPTREALPLAQVYRTVDEDGRPTGERVRSLAPGQIRPVSLFPREGLNHPPERRVQVRVHNLMPWRVGPNRACPDPAVLAELEERVRRLAQEAEEVEARIAAEEDETARLRLTHRRYVLRREEAEYRLSLLLNRRKLAQGGVSTPEDLFTPDPEIAVLGRELNQLRVKRRIFDYVVAAL